MSCVVNASSGLYGGWRLTRVSGLLQYESKQLAYMQRLDQEFKLEQRGFMAARRRSLNKKTAAPVLRRHRLGFLRQKGRTPSKSRRGSSGDELGASK